MVGQFSRSESKADAAMAVSALDGHRQGWVYAFAASSYNDAHRDSNIQQARADTLSQIRDGRGQGGTLALVDGEYACKGEREGPLVICFRLVILGGPAAAANVLDLAGVIQFVNRDNVLIEQQKGSHTCK